MQAYRAVYAIAEKKLKVYKIEGAETELKWETDVDWNLASPPEVAELIDKALNAVRIKEEMEAMKEKRIVLKLEKVEDDSAIYGSYFMCTGHTKVELPIAMFEDWIPRIIAISVKFNPDREEVQEIIGEHNREVRGDED